MGVVRLAALALEGFKSFATRAELSFPGQIIAIVGPNGSGKSNIADAIAWVLGEQSARLLRSQTMADVIFAGSPRRAPLGGAAVTLYLTAGDGRWASGGDRLEVSRRVLRDGTSDYRVGGKRARLKDVLDHLLDAGLGTRAYAIIEQGRIGQVLSVRATERRALFEEAAGITKFRVRRHEAELKLAETRANLLRLADVASEVRRGLEAARRQARRAERHRELSGELLTTRAALLAARRAILLASRGERQHAMTAATLADAAAAAALAGVEAELENARRLLDSASERLAAAREEEGRANAGAQRREAEEAAARREHEDANARRAAAAIEAGKLTGLLHDHTDRETVIVATLEAAGATASRATATATATQAAAAGAEEAARRAGSQSEEARRTLLKAAGAATETRNRVHRLEVEIEQTGYQRSRLEAERERLAAHVAQVAGTGQQAAARESELAGRAAATADTRRELERRHEAEAARATELTAARDRAGHERWQAQHEREGLTRALAAASALPQVLARALPAEDVLGTMADFLQPDPEVARALDQAYGELLNAPVIRDEAAVQTLVKAAAKAEGRLRIVLADRSLPPRPSPLLEQAGAAAVDLGWLSRALPRATTTADDAEAVAVTTADPDMVVVLPGGGRRLGTRVELPGGKSTAPGILELRIKIREAAAAQAAAQARETTLGAELEACRRLAAELQREREVTDTAAREAAEGLAAAASTRQSLDRERARLERETEALTRELARLAGEATALEARLMVARQESDRLAGQVVAAEGEVDALARDAERAREAFAAARTEAERRRGEAALASERHNAARREVERHQREQADLQARRQQAEAEAEAQRRRAEAAAAGAVSARADLELLLARRSAAHSHAEILAAEVEAQRATVAVATAATEAGRRAYLEARDASHAAELAATETEAAWERLQETVALTLQGRIALPDQAPDAATLPDLETTEKRLATELEALGPVNELAVAERDELEERHRFLATQRRDLERSLESLGETVKDLDATCATRFLATLEEANTAFDATFKTLFGGGEARAELSDPEAPLESGIEIRVRAPGKHTQSVLLLSGGEKALAAVALLLALFRIRPAPFCLLDEVDAPLDDSNVERLCTLLREMSADTQFLLITHNRRTMAHADVLYGVTMEEPGVSRIVSVRMED